MWLFGIGKSLGVTIVCQWPTFTFLSKKKIKKKLKKKYGILFAVLLLIF